MSGRFIATQIDGQQFQLKEQQTNKRIKNVNSDTIYMYLSLPQICTNHKKGRKDGFITDQIDGQ